MKLLIYALISIRVVSLSPNITDMLIDLGYGDSLLGVTDYCEVPEGIHAKRVGGWVDPNLELVVKLKPDLVLITDAQMLLLKDKIEKLHLPVEVLPSERISDILYSLEKLGVLLSLEERAESLIRILKDSLERVRKKASTLKRPRVLIVGDRTPGTLENMYVAGGETYLDELIEIAGGINAASNIGAGYFILSKERLLSIDPDIIIDITEDKITPYKELKELSAVREGMVYSLPPSPLTHPSTRVLQSIEILFDVLHPELSR